MITRSTIGLCAIAERLGITYETARRWAQAGKLPVFKFNGVGRWRAYEVDVDAYVAKHQTDAAAWASGK